MRRAARLRTALAVGAATALLLSSTVPAGATGPVPAGGPKPGVAVPAGDNGSGVDTIASGGDEVVLLTGDRVTVLTGADGHTTYRVTPGPGRSPVFTAYGDGEDLYVVPDDAAPAVAAGVVDPELFNVRELVRQGLTGPDTAVPVILTHQPSADVAAMAGFGVDGSVRDLPSIGGSAMRLTPADASAFWREVGTAPAAGPQAAGRLRGGVTRIWLDRVVKVVLDQSVHQIGAPAAWAAGYDGSGVTVAVIDTGIDPHHPDVAGKIVASENFTDEPDVTDGHGHGTHVASIAVGTGAASDGTFTGVAPGASLMVAKALRADGTGQTSWVIDAMEWAATNGADIINLSLGSEPTDGTDPASLAVDALSEQTGALFVVASGNDFQDQHVLAPGTASSALTVGAVNRQDVIPSFSNRGPRRGDAAVKPELTAPGVGIAAARAAGTSMGRPVDEHYTRADGTSMATPHVTGVAALLAQAHPDWDWRRLKDAVVSTTAPAGYQWWQGGTGRLDADRALNQGVHGPGAVSLGVQPFPQDGLAPVTRKLTYHNETDADVELSLSADLTGFGGTTVATGLSLSPTTLTVPAGGSADVVLTLDPSADPQGVYGGVVTAATADGAVSVRTAVSWYNETEAYDATVRVTGHRGGTPAASVTVQAIRVEPAGADDPFHRRDQVALASAATGEATFRLPAGLYHIQAAVVERSASFERATLAVQPEVAVSGDAEIALDARAGVDRRPPTGGRTDVPARNMTVIRGMPDGTATSFSLIGNGDQEVYATPTPPVSRGFLEFTNQWTFTEPLVELEAVAPQRLSLTPGYDPFTTGPVVDGVDTELDLVYVDQAEPGSLAGVAGKVALVRVPIPGGLSHPQSRSHAVVAAVTARDALAAAGAAAALIYVDIPGAPAIHGPDVPSTTIPTLLLPYREGTRLRLLAQARPVTLRMNVRRDPGYAYHLRRDDHDRIPATPPAPVDPQTMVRLETSYHGDAPDMVYESIWAPRGPRDVFSVHSNWQWWGPTARTEYVGETGTDLEWRRLVWQNGTLPDGTFQQLLTNAYDRFDAGAHREDERWFAAPIRTGAVELSTPTGLIDTLCENCRDGDGFVPGRHWLDGTPGHRMLVDFPTDSEVRLWHGDREIPAQAGRSFPWFLLPPEPGTFRLERVDHQPGVPAVRKLATQVRTTWTFHSHRPEGPPPDGYTCPLGGDTCAFQPLLVADLDAGLDLTNTFPHPRDRRGPPTVELHVRHHAGLDGPQIAWARLWTSYDDGQTWRERTGTHLGDGRYRFILDLRDPQGTSGYVSVRLEAADVEGNRIEQEIIRAWQLPPR
jgi:subtilisin family serine protease